MESTWAGRWRVRKQSRIPAVAELGSRAPQIMRIEGRDRHFVHEDGAEFFNGSNGGEVVGICGDDDRGIKRANKRREGAAGLERVGMAAERRGYFITDVPGNERDVVRVTDAEVDSSGIAGVRQQNAKMVIGHEAERGVAGNDLVEAERDLAVRQLQVCGRCGQLWESSSSHLKNTRSGVQVNKNGTK